MMKIFMLSLQLILLVTLSGCIAQTQDTQASCEKQILDSSKSTSNETPESVLSTDNNTDLKKNSVEFDMTKSFYGINIDKYTDKIDVKNKAIAIAAAIRANAVCTVGMYDFSSISEFTPNVYSNYIRAVFLGYPFANDIIEYGQKLQSGEFINYDEILFILNNEFALNELPFKVKDESTLYLEVSPGDYDPCELISIKQDDKIIKVILQPKQRYLGRFISVNPYSIDKNGKIKAEFKDDFQTYDEIIDIKIEYTFKINSEQLPVLQSGKRIA